jgi:hypothetical protein
MCRFTPRALEVDRMPCYNRQHFRYHSQVSLSGVRPIQFVRTQIRNAQSLILLVLVAVALTWLISGRDGATAAFQSPNPFESELLTPTVEPSAFPTATATLSPTPTLVPTMEATPAPTLSPTPLGFLPPPTLTSPGTPVPEGPPSSLPDELPVRVAPTEPPPPEQIAGRPLTSPTTTLAGLIDQGVLAMGYLWLCCGVLALVGVGGALIWFLRRSRRG